MTGNTVLDLAISLGGIAFLLVLIRWLFPLGSAIITEKSALERLAFDEPDFKPHAWLIDQSGMSALALSDGEAALIKRNGVDLATRRTELNTLRVDCDGALLTVSVDDATFPPMHVTAGTNEEAAHWCRRLTE